MANIATDRTVAACIANGNTSIPLRKSPNKTGSSSTSPGIKTSSAPVFLMNDQMLDKMKLKYEESEIKRKELIALNEKSQRSYSELEKKYNSLQAKWDETEIELFEKNEDIAKIRTAAKDLYKEYSTLKNQYEAETGAMYRALNDASQWYKENKALKRRTMCLDKDTVDEGVDDGETSTDSELDNLKESLKQLSMEVAQLQTELNAAKLLEFEASEQNINLALELEVERNKSAKLETEVRQLKANNEQLLRVSNMFKRELEDLKQSEQNQRDSALVFRKEANDFKRERNVLAHQSALLLHRINSNDGPDKILLLQEIEELKRTVEEERNRHNLEISNLQEKIEETEKNSHNEILEERLKLVEAELHSALERAETAEKCLRAPPAPPMPPPLPLMVPTAPIRIKKLSRNSIPELAEALGVQSIEQENYRKPPTAAGVNEDIINQIKDGKFTLRKARKENSKKERETPKAVSEMLNILGSLRRAPKNRISLSKSFADVQL